MNVGSWWYRPLRNRPDPDRVDGGLRVPLYCCCVCRRVFGSTRFRGPLGAVQRRCPTGNFGICVTATLLYEAAIRRPCPRNGTRLRKPSRPSLRVPVACSICCRSPRSALCRARERRVPLYCRSGFAPFPSARPSERSSRACSDHQISPVFRAISRTRFTRVWTGVAGGVPERCRRAAHWERDAACHGSIIAPLAAVTSLDRASAPGSSRCGWRQECQDRSCRQPLRHKIVREHRARRRGCK